MQIATERVSTHHRRAGARTDRSHITQNHDNLFKSITDEQKAIFEKFTDCWGEYESLAEEAIFAYAFRLGARLMLDVLSNE